MLNAAINSLHVVFVMMSSTTQWKIYHKSILSIAMRFPPFDVCRVAKCSHLRELVGPVMQSWASIFVRYVICLIMILKKRFIIVRSAICAVLERERNQRIVTNVEFVTTDLQLMNIYESKI